MQGGQSWQEPRETAEAERLRLEDYLRTICWDFASSGYEGNNSYYLDILLRFNSFNSSNHSEPLPPSFVWTTLYHGAEILTPYDADYKATEFDLPTQTFTQMVLAAVYKDKLWNRNEVWYRTTNLQTFAFSADQLAEKNLLQIGYTFDQEGVIYLAEINTLQYTTLLSQWAGVWVIVPSLLMLAFVAVKDKSEEEPAPDLHIRFTKKHRLSLKSRVR
ncbi:hypothetical protein KFL_006700040 [Klebsormidium nitens]|uniref:Uncharacterized protein n=1 Tax=Klebsormidium nitens TaxID=105231 RepID=A0A1Y1IPG0_KLENI|nr:hypothetical protein KFL_006700040 [Klebsormidium nitens]|eukprot:GAQ90666.1 hypothetical protein KFL_006700040 [Klebsormidium nitens]